MELSKIALKIIKCTSCGSLIRGGNDKEEVVCENCGNKQVVAPSFDKFDFNNIVKSNVESNGEVVAKTVVIKTSSSALAYIEHFLTDYEWEIFALGDDFYIEELDEIVDEMQLKESDKPDTWVATFLCKVIPFVKKIEYRKCFLEEIIREYKKNNGCSVQILHPLFILFV